jgi:hypothetical protein
MANSVIGGTWYFVNIGLLAAFIFSVVIYYNSILGIQNYLFSP